MKKIGCLIYHYGKRYQEIGMCAKNSFYKHHPDIALHHVNDENSHLYNATKFFDKVPPGAHKYMLAAEIMEKNRYNKIIVLGADTITCARLSEFLNDDEHDIIGTLDYPYPLYSGTLGLAPPGKHLNADVICFNNTAPIVDIIKLTQQFKNYAEQGALNWIAWGGNYDYKVSIADGPYKTSAVVYNVRSKGNICLPKEYQDRADLRCEKPWGPYTNKFFVENNRIYTGDEKQIKVWHYCEGLGNLKEEEFIKIMNNWIFKWFNKETRIFFKENCNCGDFFEKEFTI